MVYKHIAATSTGILSPQTHTNLVCVTVNTGAASAILKLYDGQDSTSGTLVAQIDASVGGAYWFGGARLSKGLYFDLSGGNADITIVFG